MLRISRTGAAGLFAVALAATPALAADPITGDQIEDMLIGNTVVGEMNDGHDYAEFYAPGGVVIAEDYHAQWSIEGDEMCFDYSRADKSCFGVAVDMGKVQWLDDGEVVGEGHVLPGNPHDF